MMDASFTSTARTDTLEATTHGAEHDWMTAGSSVDEAEPARETVTSRPAAPCAAGYLAAQREDESLKRMGRSHGSRGLVANAPSIEPDMEPTAEMVLPPADAPIDLDADRHAHAKPACATPCARTATNGKAHSTLVVPFSGNFLDALQAGGVDVAGVARDVGATQAELEAGVSVATADAFTAKAFEEIDDPAFGLLAGQRMDPERFGIVGFLAMTSATLGEAFHQLCRFSRLNWWDVCHMTEHEETVTVHLYPVMAGRPYTHAKLEMGLAGLVAFARRFTRHSIEPLAARVSRPRPACSALYEEILRCPVKFCDEDSITFRRADLSRRLVSANPPLSAVLEQQADASFTRMVGTGFLDKVRVVVQRIMRAQDPSVSAVAGELAMSIRTLQRRLADEGVRFNDLVDDIRREAAERYLSAGKISMIEVAFLLGFADPNSFYRAFKRWTGTTPMAYRQTAQQERRPS